MALRDSSEVGVPDVRRFGGLKVTDGSAAQDSRPRAPARRRKSTRVPVSAVAGADVLQSPGPKAEAELGAAVDGAALLGDELQVHLQADVPDVALQRVKLVSFELGDDRPHLRRHQTILGALVWEYVDHTDQRKLDELADLLDAYRLDSWHGLPEVRRLSARMPTSLKRRVEGTVLALSHTQREVSAKALLAALVWRHVISREDDHERFARLADVVGAYHQEMARRSLSAPVASVSRRS